MDMAFLEFLLYQLFFLLIGSAFMFFIRSRHDYAEAEYLHRSQKILMLGFIGWIIAYSRIILIQIYQVLLLVANGVDISDTDAVTNAPITGSYIFIMIGPLLSGPFEEGIRFWLMMKVIGFGRNPVDRKYIPLLFGYAWAYSEIIILTLPFLGIGPVNLANLAISGFERLMAVMIHISFSYIVLYGKFKPKLKTVGLAMLLHVLFNTVIVIFAVELGAATWEELLTIEAIIALMAVMVTIFTKYYRSEMEESLVDQL